MNMRLVWNFEISNKNPLDLNDLKDSRDEKRWEARYFWPGNTIINLNGLDTQFLALSNYEVKHRHDCYILLADSNYNIKQRRMQVLYKPLLGKTELLRGYGKKINLADYPPDLILPGSKNLKSSDLLKQLEKNQQVIEVQKEALIYKFTSEPKIKLELARLEIDKKIYLSLCVEGHSQYLVESIARHLLATEVSCDYVSFLKRLAAPC
ncbi:MAG: hypothetical protein H0U73_10565 [Tatlockia sp.]|nr:hypothetical protein [Tatlockia sp.]